MRNLALREKAAFLLVGASASVCYIMIAKLLNWGGLTPTAASAVSYLLCIPLAYAGQRRITFRSSRRHHIAMVRYIATQGLGLTIATATVHFTASAGLPALLAFVLADVVASAQTYLLQKHWVY